MYDFPELATASHRFWKSVRAGLLARGVGADDPAILPNELLSTARQNGQLQAIEPAESSWTRADLLFSQTCGYPYVMNLREHVTLIGTPDYGEVRGRPGWYDSVVVVRRDDPRDQLEHFENTRFVFNALDSQSGCHAMMHLLLCQFGERRFFVSCLKSGAHVASIRHVAAGDADVAAIDAVTWRFASRYLPESRALRILTRTPPTPGLPFISAQRRSDDAFADAVECATQQLSADDKQTLGLRGLWRSTPGDYELIRDRALAAAPVLQAHLPVILEP